MSEGDENKQAELIGHESVLQYFGNARSLDRIATTYLLAGPPGIGKRVAAKTAAKILLCENLNGNTSCGACPTCRGINEDTSLHFIERDFTQEQGSAESVVDVVRRFIDEIERLGSNDLRLVYLIPNIQDYSIQVQNALLKTLEEPPVNITMMLTADKPERVLETIASRSQIIKLYPLPLDTLRQIMKKYGCEPENEQQVLLNSGGRADLALNYSDSSFQELFTWTERLLDNSNLHFLEVAEKASEQAENLNGPITLRNEKSDREKISRWIEVFEKVYYQKVFDRCRYHFVAMQILNTAVDELLTAKYSVLNSGHILLSLEHYLQVALSRYAQMIRFSKMKESEPLTLSVS